MKTHVWVWIAGLLILSAPGIQETGRAAAPRIVGGSPAASDAYPWVVQLVDAASDSLYDGHWCAGTLIHPRWILTAAHCAVDDDGRSLAPSDIDVVTDIHDLRADSGTRLPIDRLIVHPGFDDGDYWRNDIALIELATPADFAPIPLVAQGLELAGQSATVLGWGDTTGYYEFPDLLHEVTVPVVSNTDCNEAFLASALYSEPPISGEMLCAGSPGRDACYDDSGGPLVIQNDAGHVLAGLVSWGEGCAQPGFFGVYTRVASFYDFIRRHAPEVNRAPNGEPDAYEVAAGEVLRVPAPGVMTNDTDPDGDSLTARLTTDAIHGPVSLGADGGLTYTPAAGFRGSDEFSYGLDDGYDHSAPIRVTLTVSESSSDDGGGGGGCFIRALDPPAFPGFGGKRPRGGRLFPPR